MRPTSIAVGFLVLFAVFAGIAYIQIALLVIGVLVCGVVLFGFLSGAHQPRQIRLPRGSRSEEDGPQTGPPKTVQVEGRRFDVNAMPDSLDLRISCRNSSIVAGIVLVAISAVVISLISLNAQHIDMENPLFYSFYALCVLVAILLIPAFMWLGESSLMKQPGVTLAAIYGKGASRFGGKWLTYGFSDVGGGHHGGSSIDFGGPDGDDFKVVFCDPRNPTRNKLSCSLLFYKVAWVDNSSE